MTIDPAELRARVGDMESHLNVACGAAQVIRMLTHYKHPLDDPDDLEGLAWVATELVAAMELMEGCFADLHRLAGGSAERHQG